MVNVVVWPGFVEGCDCARPAFAVKSRQKIAITFLISIELPLCNSGRCATGCSRLAGRARRLTISWIAIFFRVEMPGCAFCDARRRQRGALRLRGQFAGLPPGRYVGGRRLI